MHVISATCQVTHWVFRLVAAALDVPSSLSHVASCCVWVTHPNDQVTSPLMQLVAAALSMISSDGTVSSPKFLLSSSQQYGDLFGGARHLIGDAAQFIAGGDRLFDAPGEASEE